MQHVDYVCWAQYIDMLLQKFGSSSHRVLDVACGTGNFLFELQKYCYQLSGFDYTPEMVIQAYKKSMQRHVPVPLWCGNMVQFAVKQPQDAIICLYDSINYLLSIELCQQFFEQCSLMLQPGGLLIFDICTEWNSIIHFQNFQDRERTELFTLTRHSYYREIERFHFNEFKLVYNNKNVIYHEVHQQKIYYIKEIIESIPSKVFNLLAAYDGFSETEGTEKSERVHFVLKKK